MKTWLALFLDRAHAHPDRVAVVSPVRTLTYGELLARARKKAAERPAGSEDAPVRHLICSADSLGVLEEIVATWLAGAVPAVVHEGLPARLRESYGELFERLSQPGARRRALAIEEGLELPSREGLILTTSGTTDAPKLVSLTHESVFLNVTSLLEWYRAPDDTQQMVATSLSRGTGLNSGALIGLAAGWTVHLFPPGYPPPPLQAHMRARGVTLFNATPAFLRLFLAYWNRNPFDSVLSVTMGGESPSPHLLEELAAAFPRAEIVNAYGMTEAGSRVAQLSVRDSRSRRGGVGIPLPHFDWKIVPAEGVQPPAGQLLLGGPAVFRGYLADDDRLSGRDAEGYFPTGDVVSADTDGCLIHGGRLDGLVKVGGYLVNPMEVERLIRSLPGVNDAHCVAKPHDILGRCLEVDVLLAAGAHATAEEIRRACAERLEPFKVPRQVNVVRHIDLTAMGKAPRA